MRFGTTNRHEAAGKHRTFNTTSNAQHPMNGSKTTIGSSMLGVQHSMFPSTTRRIGVRRSNPASLPWFGGLMPRRRSLLHPAPILLIQWIRDDGCSATLRGSVKPSVGFGMSVGKRKAATAVVVGPGSVKPFGGLHAKGKSRVIKAPRIFIHQNPQHGRTRIADVAGLAIG